jgi:hypothetical protein
MLGALKKGPVLSVSQSVKISKKYYPEYGPCHPSSGSSNQEVWGGTAPSTLPTFQVLKSHAAYLSSVEIPRCLPFKR